MARSLLLGKVSVLFLSALVRKGKIRLTLKSLVLMTICLHRKNGVKRKSFQYYLDFL